MAINSNKELDEMAKYYSTDKDKLWPLVENYMQNMRVQEEIYRQNNPTDAPNSVLKHAIVNGIKFYADETLTKGDFLPFLKIGPEQFYIWTYEEDTEAVLIVEVDPLVKTSKIWKTAVSVLAIALAISRSLEGIFEFEYDWVYRFNIKDSINDFHYLYNRDFVNNTSSIHRVPEIQHILPIIDLLNREDKFYVACQNIIQAKLSHDFCQTCALTPEHARKHHDYEPELWEQISWITKMEAAIVQATRTVESLIGKPGKKMERVKERWKDFLDIDPDDTFEMANKSYLDYYYELFQIRGSAAHSLGEITFDLTRSITIKAQSFAWLILVDYCKKSSLSNVESIENLKFNNDLIDKFPENLSTNRTKKISPSLHSGIDGS